MAGDSDKVAKLVKLKLEDYFNRQRVENEFDSSGKGIHTTTPLVVQLELSYLQAAEQQWKANKKDARQKNPETKQSKKEIQKSRDGDKSNKTELSPRIKTNSKLKSRMKGSEIERITKNAQTAMNRVSVNRIHSVHRYRPHLTPAEYVDLGKVAHVSPHVNAILNTEYAWKNAEDNDDREAARKYVQEKMESKAKEKDDEKDERPTSTDSRERRTPLWLRVKKESQSSKENTAGEPIKESDGATEDADDVSKNDETRRHDDDDTLPREDQDILTSTDDRQDTTSDQDKGNGDIESGGSGDAVDGNSKDEIQDVERVTGAKQDDERDTGAKQDVERDTGAKQDIERETGAEQDSKRETGAEQDIERETGAEQDSERETGAEQDSERETGAKQGVERYTGAKEGEPSEETDIKEHEFDNDRHKGIPDGKDDQKSEEYVRTESMLSFTTVDNT